MADYPSLPQELETKRTVIPGDRIDIADDGSFWKVAMHAQDTFRFSVVHRYLTEAERDQVISCYGANRTGEIGFTLLADGSTYTVCFEQRPEDNHLGGGHWEVVSVLVGRAA